MTVWNKSESIGLLATALCKVQGQMRPAVKDAKNPFFKSTYADLNSVWDACRNLLTENELSVAQLPGASDGLVTLTTVLMHSSGEWISSEASAEPKATDPQGIGSAITYLRRYGLAAMLGIVADEDDDGNAGSGRGKDGNGQASKSPAQATGTDKKPGQLIAEIKAASGKSDKDWGAYFAKEQLGSKSAAELAQILASVQE